MNILHNIATENSTTVTSTNINIATNDNNNLSVYKCCTKCVPAISVWPFLRKVLRRWLSVWRVAGNVMNKQQQTSGNGVLQFGCTARC
jgi:hypothetical protein